MSAMKRWISSVWDELWIETPTVWVWVAMLIALPWWFASGLVDFSPWVGAAVFIPLGLLAYALTWGRPTN